MQTLYLASVSISLPLSLSGCPVHSCAVSLVCRRGQVLFANVNEATMVPFVSQSLGNLDLALALARRGNLPGAEGLVGQHFERLFASGQFKDAAEAAAGSPQVFCFSICLGSWLFLKS